MKLHWEKGNSNNAFFSRLVNRKREEQTQEKSISTLVNHLFKRNERETLSQNLAVVSLGILDNSI